MKTTSINKIVFNVSGKTLELSAEEAKELKNILSDLFDGKVEHVHHYDRYHYPHTSPYWSYTLSGASTGLSTLCNGTSTTSDTVYLTNTSS